MDRVTFNTGFIDGSNTDIRLKQGLVSQTISNACIEECGYNDYSNEMCVCKYDIMHPAMVSSFGQPPRSVPKNAYTCNNK